MLIPYLLATRMKQVHKAKGRREERLEGNGAGSCRQRKSLGLREVYSLHAAWESTMAFKWGTKEEFALAVHIQLGQFWSPFFLGPWGPISYSRAGGGTWRWCLQEAGLRTIVEPRGGKIWRQGSLGEQRGGVGGSERARRRGLGSGVAGDGLRQAWRARRGRGP